MSTREARNIFIDKATRIMQYRMCLAIGESPPDGVVGDLPGREEKQHDYYIDELIKEIHKLTDVQELEAKNSAEVLKLVGQGKITFAEAKELMQLFQMQMEIEELPKLLEALEQAEQL